MKPLLSYYGGKQRIASKILEHIEKIPHTVYGEPFAGGAALLFAKPIRQVLGNTDYREFINDKSDLLINFYRVAVLYENELINEINATLYSQSDYARAVSICKNPDGCTDLQKAWAYYVNAQMSFASQLNGGWGTSVFSQNQAATWNSKIENLREKIKRIKLVHISSEDALKCIGRWDSPQTLIYVDPPYPNANQGHYKGYTEKDWAELCDVLDSCQSSYILSNYNQKIEPKSAQEKIEIKAICSASGKGKVNRKDKSTAASQEELAGRERTEILWICNRSAKMRKELSFANYKQACLF